MRELLACVHATKEANGLGDICRSISGGGASDDWLGGGDGVTGSRGVGPLWNFVLVAVSAFSCDCLDVPGRLFACGNLDASSGGSRWIAHVPANCAERDWFDWDWLVAVAAWINRSFLFLWGARSKHGTAASLLVGGYLQIQCTGEVADARNGAAHSDPARPDDVRQGWTLIAQPALNAILNGTSAVLLVCGYAAI